MKNWKARASPPPDATQCRNDVVDHVLQQGHRHSFKFNHSEEYRGKKPQNRPPSKHSYTL